MVEDNSPTAQPEETFEQYKAKVEEKLKGFETLIQSHASKDDIEKVNKILGNFQLDIVELKADGATSKQFETRLNRLQEELRSIGGDILSRLPAEQRPTPTPEKKSPVLVLDW
jgi:hypothetical protein